MSKARSKKQSKPRQVAAATVVPTAAQPVFNWTMAGLATLLFVAIVVAYLPVIGNGYIWDDADYVTENQTLRTFGGLVRMWCVPTSIPQYYPLVHTTFWLEYHLWGLNPVGYHLDNVLLHAVAAILLWRVLVRLQVRGAWLAAAIFGLHPVCVESVAWITERKNVLSAVCYFAAAMAYLRWTEADDKSRTTKSPSSPDRTWYFLALGLFVCALWSKTVACSLPAALLLVRWWKEGRVTRRDVIPLLPFFSIGIVLGLVTAWLEKHHVGAHGIYWNQTFLERCLIASRVPWFYVGKLLWPSPLMMVYPRWAISTAVWWQWLFPAGLLGVAAALWFWRSRIGRGPLVAVLFFVGTLFPALGFLNVYPMRFSFVADHFQYLASIGMIVLFVAVLCRILGRVQKTAAVLLLPLGILAWQHIHDFKNLETLWTTTLKKNPNCSIAHNNIATMFTEQGNFSEAEKHYHEALRFEPDDGETMSNLGATLAQEGQYDQAIELLHKAAALAPENAEVHANLGKVLAEHGHPAEAVTSFETAIRLRPTQPEFRYGLGSILVGLGRVDEAIGQFRKALEYRPDYPNALNNLGLALAGLSKYDEAVALYLKAVQLDPNHALAHNNLGNALLRFGHLDEAVHHFNEALRVNPDYANAHFNLGNALALQKKYEEAVAQFSETLRISPDYAAAHRNMGLALARLGRREAAEVQLREALRLQPNNSEIKEQLNKLSPAPDK